MLFVCCDRCIYCSKSAAESDVSLSYEDFPEATDVAVVHLSFNSSRFCCANVLVHCDSSLMKENAVFTCILM